ncbi:MAG: cache domain-containing protein [Lachnospiraceae bacterium]|nr:cache domain-containing protein [Lachnospiraceae bacterium]
MKLTIRKKIFLCSLVPVCLLGAIVIFAAATFVRGSIIEQVKKSLQGTAVATLAAYDQNSGEYMEAENGAIWKGSYNISQSENLVDTIKAESGMDVTFFYGSRRIMTSALDQNGSRILGSPAGDLIVEKVLKGGEEYFSENVSMDGTLYYGYYVPVYQKGGTEPVGMVFAGSNKAEMLADVMNIIYGLIVIVVLVVLLCIVTVGIYASSMTKALRRSILGVQKVAEGRLDVEFEKGELRRKDEIGDLTRAIQSLQQALKNIIGGIRESTDRLVDASDVLEHTSRETFGNINNVKHAVNVITQGADSQAEDTRNASDRVRYMGDLIIETGREADELNGSADVMRQSGDRAAETIEELKQINEEVRSAVDKIAGQTRETNESAKRIKEASDFISEIASETNLLALNASIEAARAGDAGRGFAVVATQIQKLAEQSNNASGSIDEIVNELIQNAGLVVNTMDGMQEVIEKQNRHIVSTEETIEDVMKEIQTSVHSIRSIEQKTKELEKARTQIVSTLESLSDIAQDNVASTKETKEAMSEVTDRFQNVADSAGDLRGTADMLAQNIGNFTL